MAGPLVLTMGEPAGIGGEVALKAWLARESEAVPPFFMIDDADRLATLAERLGWLVPITPIGAPEEAAAIFADALPVLSRPLSNFPIPGTADPAHAGAVIAAIDEAVDLVVTGRAAAVVTNPIHKLTLTQAGFHHNGHTDYLAELAGDGSRAVMMLACASLRVVPLSVHISLRDSIQALTEDAIIETANITAAALTRDFGIAQPHIVIAGLNPHAGEGGTMGREDTDIIAPAIEKLKRAGLSVRGPAPSDTLFHERARSEYDAAICMYHDQALIPIKTIDFFSAVNVTIGLPFIRTSPDHGTAFEIAGTGVADERSLIAALRMAAMMADRRLAGITTADAGHA
ncbi:MAG: 4-hydroxythreonine-4-phosphate dehydrogenase PdxA [Alphaproteobacteria bacterium]